MIAALARFGPLLGISLFFAIGLGWRTWLQHRRYGRSGVILFRQRGLWASSRDALLLVLPALLPSWAQELWHARALVTDSGGAFCHGAILARERGLPAVLGTHVATRHIRDGQELWVDAAAGRVLVLP